LTKYPVFTKNVEEGFPSTATNSAFTSPILETFVTLKPEGRKKMRLTVFRFFVLLSITSFILSLAIGCGGRQRSQIKTLESRVVTLERSMETMNKNMGTMKKVMDRVDSLDKRVTTLEQRAYDLEKTKKGVDTPVPVETGEDRLEKEQ
jgi:hypothetical protein